MAHWFHRNPLKATAPVGFELKSVLTNSHVCKICTDLRILRCKLLDLLTNPNNEVSEVEDDFNSYLSLLYGFLVGMDVLADGANGAASSTESKLRRLIRFKWSNSMLGYVPTELNDAVFEMLCQAMNVAIWLTKHAAKISGKDEVSEDEAKEIHKCLRKAAGVFAYVLEERSKLDEQFEPGSDFDPKLIGAYINQCTAEAQEVTVARAIELKHNAGLISSLSFETSELFRKSDENLTSLNPAVFEKWRKYLQLKQQFYLAYAFSFRGEALLAEDKCGEAIRCLQESQKCYTKAEELCAEYAKAKGPGVGAKPEKHLFFRKLKPVLDRTLGKCERENGFIYHQKVPAELPELEIKKTFGLVKPQLFEMPPPAELWTSAAYRAFDISKASMPDFSKAKTSDQELPAVKEQAVYQTDKDPKNGSGCVIS